MPPATARGPGRPRSADRHRPRHLVAIPADLYQALADFCREENRPVNWEIRALIEARLRSLGRLPKKSPPPKDG